MSRPTRILVATIDLVLATVTRTEELVRFLRSLEAQTYRDFRLIVVDQNHDGRLLRMLADFEGAFEIVHLRSDLGNSVARNVGLDETRASIVGFPDDDCWYPDDLLEQVAEFFARHREYQGLSGRTIDETGHASAGRWDRQAGRMTRFNVWKRTCACTVFLRSSVAASVGYFDETLGLGPGARWAAAEDLDYVLRSIQDGFASYYDPDLCIYHRQTREGSSSPTASAGHHYGMGAGRVLKKNGLPWWFAVYYCGRSFGASVLSLITGNRSRARFYWAVGRGRLRGWRSVRTSA